MWLLRQRRVEAVAGWGGGGVLGLTLSLNIPVGTIPLPCSVAFSLYFCGTWLQPAVCDAKHTRRTPTKHAAVAESSSVTGALVSRPLLTTVIPSFTYELRFEMYKFMSLCIPISLLELNNVVDNGESDLLRLTFSIDHLTVRPQCSGRVFLGTC